jgi:hypothetical protein
MTLPAIPEVAAEEAWLPPDAIDDIAYARAEFVAMADADRPHVARGALPRATYVLPDGTPMVPADHAELLRDAAGDPDAIGPLFSERFVAAGGDPAQVEAYLDSWLSGRYGACLRSTAPEAIVVKDSLMDAISALLARPALDDHAWRAALRASVDALDAHERPFAAHDRVRFGRPVSRDVLIDAVRERFPELWT